MVRFTRHRLFAQLREHQSGLYAEVELLLSACVDRTVARVSLLIHTQHSANMWASTHPTGAHTWCSAGGETHASHTTVQDIVEGPASRYDLLLNPGELIY